MKFIYSIIIFSVVLFAGAKVIPQNGHRLESRDTSRVHTQNGRRWQDIDTTGFYQKDSITKGKFTLIFINKEPSFSMETKQQLINLFFKVYPLEVKAFNHQSARTVTFVIDPGYTAVAATAIAITRFNPQWFKKNPHDIDCATHELMHIVQNYNFNGYGTSAGLPVWLVEGISDYARYRFGINNVEANWVMPPFHPNQHYTNSYRVAARFLIWTEQHKNKNVVKKLDKTLRDGSYSQNTWKKLTGETVDELWKDYTANPSVQLNYDAH